MRACEATFSVLDFEGTGAVDGHPDEPWQLGIAVLRNGRLDASHSYESLLRVGPRPFNRYAPGRHAELRHKLTAAPTLASLWPALRTRLAGRPLCAHNVATEKRFLKAAYPLETFGPWVDTLKLVRIAFPKLRSYKLEDLVPVFDLDRRLALLLPERHPHDALYDAVACTLLLETLLRMPGWETVSVAQLCRAQPARTAKPNTPASRATVLRISDPSSRPDAPTPPPVARPSSTA